MPTSADFLLLLSSSPHTRRHVLVTAAPDGSTVLHMSNTHGTAPVCSCLDAPGPSIIPSEAHRLVGGICDAQALLLSVFLGDVPCEECCHIVERERERLLNITASFEARS